jgi:hypothetical protein
MTYEIRIRTNDKEKPGKRNGDSGEHRPDMYFLGCDLWSEISLLLVEMLETAPMQKRMSQKVQHTSNSGTQNSITPSDKLTSPCNAEMPECVNG